MLRWLVPATAPSRRRSASAASLAALAFALAAPVALAATESPGTSPVATPTPAPTPEATPGGPPPEAIASFRSRPDLRPPILTVEAAEGAGDELLFVTPRFGGEGEGVVILDASGELVWLHRVPGRSAAAFQPTRYQDAPALSWWEGVVERGLGDGEFVIVDQTYREVARVRALGYPTDLHELLVTPQGTAYLFAMDQVEVEGQLIDDMLIQEVDVPTGRLLWEWRASDHIALDESVEEVPEDGPWDYVHFNSIDLEEDGDLIVSARHTDAVYRIDRESGEIVWRLGGTASDFDLPEEAVFAKQHDARRQADGTLSLFDNATKDAEDVSVQPRGLVLRLDEEAGTAEVVRQYAPPRQVNSSSQGNLWMTDDGRATIGWGSANLVTGYDAAGEVSFDAAMPGGFSSYRAYRSDWEGRPADAPVIEVGAGGSGAAEAWVSWNGATEVVEWELLAGPDGDSLEPVERAPRDGFESQLKVPEDAAFVAVRALGADGEELGTSLVREVEAALAEPRTLLWD